MRHHTTDPALRVEDIAERVAEHRWQQSFWNTSGPGDYFREWLDTYDEVIKEFAMPAEV